MADVKAAHHSIVDETMNCYLSKVDKIFGPFNFDSIKPLMMDLVAQFRSTIADLEVNLHKLYDFRTEEKYQIDDKSVFEFDYVEKAFGDSSGQTVDNFLTRQRLLNMLSEEEAETLKQQAALTTSYTLNQKEPDASYDIRLIGKSEDIATLYTISDKWIRSFDANLTQTAIIQNKFGDVRAVDFYKEFSAFGSYSGDIFVTSGPTLDVVFKYNVAL